MSIEQKITKFGAGQILFRQDEEGGTLFFIQKGTIELTFRNNDTGEKAIIAEIGPNSVLGTMSFLEDDRRSATATAKSDVECVIVNQAQREKLLNQVPKWFKVLVKDLSGNLRSLNRKYTALENRSRQLEAQVKGLQRRLEGLKDDGELSEPGEQEPSEQLDPTTEES